MKDVLRPVLELTVVFPGLLLAYFPVGSYLKLPPAKLAAGAVPLLLGLCLGGGLLCYRFSSPTALPLLVITLAASLLYVKTLQTSLWKSGTIALAVCAAVVGVIVLKCLLGLWLARVERTYIYDLYRTLSRRLLVTYHDRGLPFVKASNSAVLARNVNVVCLAFAAGVLRPAAAMIAEAMLFVLLFASLALYTPLAALLSVVIFLLSVVFIVAMLLFKKEIGHTLGSRDIIVITMLFISMLMYWFCDVELTKIKNSSIFKGGYESLVVILGICWLASTVIGIYIPTIKEQATVLLGQYPGLLALAFFCVSALLFSQGATSALLVPVAASLGCDAPMILACFVAVSGIFVTNVYPTSAKWSGTYVINHPFFLPGCLGLVAAIPFGFLMAGLVF